VKDWPHASRSLGKVKTTPLSAEQIWRTRCERRMAAFCRLKEWEYVTVGDRMGTKRCRCAVDAGAIAEQGELGEAPPYHGLRRAGGGKKL